MRLAYIAVIAVAVFLFSIFIYTPGKAFANLLPNPCPNQAGWQIGGGDINVEDSCLWNYQPDRGEQYLSCKNTGGTSKGPGASGYLCCANAGSSCTRSVLQNNSIWQETWCCINPTPTPTPTPSPTPTPTPTPFNCSLQGGLLYSCFSGGCPADWASSSQNPNTTCAPSGQTCCWYNPPGPTPTPTPTPTTPPGGCNTNSDCGTPANSCTIVSCLQPPSGICVYNPAQAGTVCDANGSVCDGNGICLTPTPTADPTPTPTPTPF